MCVCVVSVSLYMLCMCVYMCVCGQDEIVEHTERKERRQEEKRRIRRRIISRLRPSQVPTDSPQTEEPQIDGDKPGYKTRREKRENRGGKGLKRWTRIGWNNDGTQSSLVLYFSSCLITPPGSALSVGLVRTYLLTNRKISLSLPLTKTFELRELFLTAHVTGSGDLGGGIQRGFFRGQSLRRISA